MTTVIEDKDLERQLRRYRKRIGADRYDEVWDGVYVMAAMPNNEHQKLATSWRSPSKRSSDRWTAGWSSPA